VYEVFNEDNQLYALKVVDLVTMSQNFFSLSFALARSKIMREMRFQGGENLKVISTEFSTLS
jgi:hypothetical protein